MADNDFEIKSKILRKIENELNKSFIEYFSYAWRENLDEMLTTESKYSKLVQWLNNEIEKRVSVMNCFSPADYDDYTSEFYKAFREQLSDISFMIYLRELLLDSKTTRKMRENIENTIEKVFNVKYSEQLKDYI
jgi:uncharacterized membrane protein YebE (DUF533 family)